MHPELRELIELIIAQPTHYAAHTVPPDTVRRAVETAFDTVARVLEEAPSEQAALLLAEISRDIREAPGEIFCGVSRRRPWNGEGAQFDQAVAARVAPMRDGRSVHLELGAYISWPPELVEQFIADEGVGDVIRLDMDASYPIDVAASVTALPFADETIDRICSNSLFEHVRYPNEIIAEAFRVLRPGGVLYTVVPFQFVEHRVPSDYLRFTGQFFEHTCADAGFAEVLTDTKSASGAYFTAHQVMKNALSVAELHPAGMSAVTTHLTTMVLLGCLRNLDFLFHVGASSLYCETRAAAVKPGSYQQRSWPPNRDLEFLDRYAGDLICPITGLPLERVDDELISLDGAKRWPIQNGVPLLFAMHGFASSYVNRPTSRRKMAEWVAAGSRRGSPRDCLHGHR
jgi:hypothetical protein